MNLNFNQKPDYSLNTRLIDELISLYGTPVRFLVMDKIVDSYSSDNQHDSTLSKEYEIFGDFKTLKTDHFRDELEFYVLLSENEEFPNGLQFMFNQYGMINDDTLTVFVSLRSLSSLAENGVVHPKEIVSNVLVFPNGKMMEITDCQLHVPGVNNKFVYSNTPSCYQLSLKSYNFDRSAVDLVSKNDSRIQTYQGLGQHTISNIDSFFENQDQVSEDIKDFAERDVLVISNNPLSDKVKGNKIDDVFGSYG